MVATTQYDFAGLGIEDLYRPIIPDPSPDVTDQGDPYLLTIPGSESTQYAYYLYHTDVSHSGHRIPVYGSDDLRSFEYLDYDGLWRDCYLPSNDTLKLHVQQHPRQARRAVEYVLARSIGDSPEEAHTVIEYLAETESAPAVAGGWL